MPLEALEYIVEEDRANLQDMNEICPRSDVVSDFLPAFVPTLAMLKRMESASELEQARLKYECVCVQCINGFISPRMRLSLLKTREFHNDLRNMLERAELGANFVSSAEKSMEHVPRSAQEALSIDLALCRGFVDAFQTFGVFLQGNVISSEKHIIERVLKNALRYMHTEKQSGSNSAVGSVIFKLAMNDDLIAGFGTRKQCAELQAGLRAYTIVARISTMPSSVVFVDIIVA
ncbi:hypothetical protein BDU57DRAFT_573177 [Ampelomyces quisqualis]|uniref:Uncharacterized protein n=1 Tax=Ampelomyces quisqualis TaxID=50730 RepID=A0A6A5QMV9_AMPQU|nr:hypothetical protein BDU57DRAFT_573177 [Ampelomyces quisqualis]